MGSGLWKGLVTYRLPWKKALPSKFMHAVTGERWPKKSQRVRNEWNGNI